MPDKASFVRHAKRLRWMLIGFGLIVAASALIYPPAMIVDWVLFLPVWLVLLWRLRCWNCGERLLKDGAAHLEMCRTGRFDIEMCRHKTCGASLH